MQISDVAENIKPFVIELNGQVITVINMRLAKQQGVDNEEGLKTLRELHLERIAMENAIAKNIKNKSLDEIKEFLEKWKENQFKLQAAWKFPEDEKFHRFFEIKACSCSGDLAVSNHNAINYPNGNYQYSQKCALHKHLIVD